MFHLIKRIVKVFFIYGFFLFLNIVLGSLFLLESLENTFGLDLETCGGLICILPQPTLLGFLVLIVLSILMGLLFQDFIHSIRQRKILRALILLGAVVFFVGGFVMARPFIHSVIADIKKEQHIKDAEYYKREYLEIGEPTSSEQFIYARDNRIMVSEMDGKNPRIIKEIPLDQNTKVSSVSPGGTYYIATTKNQPWKVEGGYGPDGIYYVPTNKKSAVVSEKSEVRAVADNAFIMSITNLELLQDELKLCKWSFDEQFLACRYYKDAWERKQLILFDIARGNATHIYDDSSLGGTAKNVTWSDVNLNFFYDQDEKIYRIDNIKEMSDSGFTVPPHRVLLDHLTPCLGAGAYQNNTIYCVTTVNQLVGYRKPPDNQLLTYNDGLIIAYPEPENNKPESPVVLAKAPFSFGAGYGLTLYPVDANYIAAYGISNVFFLLNLQTGKINRFQTYSIYGDDIIHGDDIGFYEHIKTENIFYNAYKGTTESNIFNNAFQGTVPVPYRGVP